MKGGALATEVVTDRRAARAAQRAGPPSSGLAEWLADRQRQADPNAERAQAGALASAGSRALRSRAGRPVRSAGRQEHSDPPAEREHDRQDQKHQREPEDDFGDSWSTYRERAEHLRQAYGWRVSQPTRATNRLRLGGGDQEHKLPMDRSRRWQGEAGPRS